MRCRLVLLFFLSSKITKKNKHSRKEVIMANPGQSASEDLREGVRRTKKFLAKQLGMTEQELESRLEKMGEEASELAGGVVEGVQKAWEDLKRVMSKPGPEGGE